MHFCLSRSAGSALSACNTLACAILAPAAVTGVRGTQSSCLAGPPGSSQLLAAMSSHLDKSSRQKWSSRWPAGCLWHAACTEQHTTCGHCQNRPVAIQALCVGEDAQQAEASSPHPAAATSDRGEDWGEVQEPSAKAEPTLAAARPPPLQLVCEESLQVCPAQAACLGSALLTATNAWWHEKAWHLALIGPGEMPVTPFPPEHTEPI